jgi:hypothetical protein
VEAMSARSPPDGGRFLIAWWVIGFIVMVRIVVAGGQLRGLAWIYRFRGVRAARSDAKIMTRKLLAVFDRWRGIDMATASVEVSGPNAERVAGELQGALVTAIEPGESVSPVEVERSADLVIAVIGLVFNGVGTAKTIWDWWHDRRPAGVKIKILLEDGTQVDLSGVDHEQLEITFSRRTPPGH